ncbi:hypothetical protein IGJ91_001289 [Enterococcus sp. DIV0765f]|uniref:hypothetical protein n=1 Tax=Enterococcus sp. DIV0765f TaxID=2774783 RepID=UPI003F25190D
MDRRLKIINILSLLLGIIVSIEFFTNWFGMLFSSLIPFLIMGVIGCILSIWSLMESSIPIEKVISVCGLLLNIIPIGYFMLLYFGLG